MTFTRNILYLCQQGLLNNQNQNKMTSHCHPCTLTSLYTLDLFSFAKRVQYENKKTNLTFASHKSNSISDCTLKQQSHVNTFLKGSFKQREKSIPAIIWNTFRIWDVSMCLMGASLCQQKSFIDPHERSAVARRSNEDAARSRFGDIFPPRDGR